MAFEVRIDGTPTNETNPWIDSLVWGGAWEDGDGGKTIITYATVSGDDPYDVLSSGKVWPKTELTALNNAFSAWEAVANIDFVKSSNKEQADIWYWLNGDLNDEAILGWHEVPGYSAGEPLYGVFNWQSGYWTPAALAKGGYSFVTLIHEIGHGLGLAHPHDGGSADDASNFPGVTGPFGDYGDDDLNQGIWTTMSYNDGWADRQSPSTGYGWQATPMAFDIAAVQQIYGANLTFATGSNIYMLASANKAGTFWSCIWDAGGSDTISASPSKIACTINLNDAPLSGENAGGYISSVQGIVGGFTIANGVTIENATGGSGNDMIVGNETNNSLVGNAGNDSLFGNDGDDKINGGPGNDSLYGGDGLDIFVFNSTPGSSNIDTIMDFSVSDDVIHLENAILKKLTGTGVLNASWFTTGDRALDSNDFIIFNNLTGDLFYDSDGSGRNTAMKLGLIDLANLDGTLTSSDFIVI